MTTHTPRARLVRNSRVLRRADEIADAAARVFAERGYHGTTTQAIADVLGMRQASLYYYFPSKEAALEEVCARGTDGFAESAERVMQQDVPPLDKLTLLIASHLAPIETMRDYVRCSSTSGAICRTPAAGAWGARAAASNAFSSR